MKLKFQVLVLTTIVSVTKANNIYCNVPTCIPNSHTLCKYTNDTKGIACGTVIRAGLTQDERDDILEYHNEVRVTVHNGKEVRGIGGRQPPAANYIPLEWDNDLELSAQRWANQCIHAKDVCRDMYEFVVGQSIDIVEDMKNFDNINSPIEAWYNQIDKFNGHDVKTYSPLKGAWDDTDYYTQMVWGKTTKIGCGLTSFVVQNQLKLIFVCNYGPSGNIENEPVY